MSDRMAEFERFLILRGNRPTTVRHAIAAAAFAHADDFDADSFLLNLRQRNEIPRISRASVFRTLDLLVKAGLLESRSVGDRTVLRVR